MTFAYIYKIVNPKGKVYIGSTKNIFDRMYRYRNNLVPLQIKISRSILKYGWENHKVSILCICEEKDRYLHEANFGNIYKCLNENGLNLSLPKLNDKVPCMSEETRIKIGNASKNKVISNEQKLKLVENLKKHREIYGHNRLGSIPWNKGKTHLIGENNPMYGIKRSQEWKIKHSEKSKIVNRRGKDHTKSKVVLDLETGVYYDTAKEVSITFNIKYSSLKQSIRKGKKRFIYVISKS